MISVREALTLRGEAKAILEEWADGAEPDARAALSRRPELRAMKSLVQDLVYEEYCLRCAAGEAPNLEAFCDRFPTFRQSLRRMLVAHEQLAEDADALAAAPQVRWPAPGERLGDLTVLRELGRGAFARVYLALEESTGARPVAVKFSPEGGAEARTMGRLTHPNIVPVLSARFEEAVGLTAVCMPYLGAATLTDLLDLAYPTADAAPPRDAAVVGAAIRSAAYSDDPPPSISGPARRPESGPYPDAIAGLAAQMADALAFLHKEGVVHRDLKPSNVLLRRDGQALLLDFNLSADARVSGPRLGGTLPYMAPEQLRSLLRPDSGEKLDGRLDLFALGVMLYELLTGRRPFGAPPAAAPPAEAAPALLERQRGGCTPLRTLNPAVGKEFAGLVEQCLAFDPAGRPASAAELAAGLRRYRAWPAQLRRWAARRPLVAAASAGLLLLAVGGAAGGVASQPPADVREYDRGRAAYLDGDYQHAEEHFNQAVRDCPTDPKPWKYCMARAAAAMRLGEAVDDGARAVRLFTDAIPDLEAAEKVRPDGATLALLGYCNSRAGNHEVALYWYDRAAEAGFTSAGLYNDRGFSRLQFGPPGAAVEDFESASKSDRNLQAAILNRAFFLLRKERPAGAPPIPELLLADLKRAVENGPGSQELYLTAGCVFAMAALNKQAANQDACTGLTLFCAQKAVASGLSPDAVLKNHFIKDVLEPLPEYGPFLSAKPGPAGPKLVERLVDPAPYLPE